VRRLTILASVRLLLAGGLLVALAAGVYAAMQLFPAIRSLREATEPLRVVDSHLREISGWTLMCQRLAVRAVVGGQRVAQDSLRLAIARYDSLEATRDMAGMGDSARVLVEAARAEASRFAVALEEALALFELRRLGDAARQVQVARQSRQELIALAAQAQASGLAEVASARRQVERLRVRFAVVFCLWVLGSGLVVGGFARLVRVRIERPLRDLQRGLARTAEGDLSVELTPASDDEIAALTREFNQMTAVLRSRAEAQGQMAAASELLARLAHEINNPLMSIGATAEGRLADRNVPETIRRDLEAIRQQARRAAVLVRGIVRFVRPLAAGEGPPDVNDVVREALDLVMSSFAADGVACSLSLTAGLPRAAMDGQKLERVLVALLTNAHEAVVRGGTADRRVTVATRAEDGRVLVEVRDTGPGVAAEVGDRLFRPFVTVREGGHIGLGLYTARRAMREAGGDLVHEPAFQGGASFVASVPAVQGPSGAPQPQAPPATSGRAPTLKGLRILLVDDEPAVRQPLARFLSRRGAQVREAGDGREALALATTGPCDLVVADLRMPGMDGNELYRALKERRPDLARRVLILSGDLAYLSDSAEGEVPPDRVLMKPVELAEFERFLLSHLSS